MCRLSFRVCAVQIMLYLVRVIGGVNRSGMNHATWAVLPPEILRLILGYLPLRNLAQMATLSKEARLVYLDRVTERDEQVVASLLSQFTAEFREGLSSAHTVLPRDLVVDPPVR
jgi:hypothetical protein